MRVGLGPRGTLGIGCMRPFGSQAWSYQGIRAERALHDLLVELRKMLAGQCVTGVRIIEVNQTPSRLWVCKKLTGLGWQRKKVRLRAAAKFRILARSTPSGTSAARTLRLPRNKPSTKRHDDPGAFDPPNPSEDFCKKNKTSRRTLNAVAGKN